METKTISIDTEAYAVLNRARRFEDEPFSQVIERARWEEKKETCGDLLAALPTMPAASADVIERPERAQQSDMPPDAPWS